MSKPWSNRHLALLGNTIEFYDLYLYTHLAIIINQKFFPGVPSDHFLLKGFSVMNLYLFAPMAAIAWGMIGDLQGRKKVLLYSSFVMSIVTFFIAFLPEYNWWSEGYGFISIALLVVLRMIQGVAIAGEPLSAGLYAIEDSKDAEKEMPRWVANITATEMVGGIFALLFAYISLNYLTTYWSGAWRIPFIFAFFSVGVTYFIRTRLQETEELSIARAHESENYYVKTHNKPVTMFNPHVYEVMQSIAFKRKNFICYATLATVYPLVFFMCYLNISPKILEHFNYPKEYILQYNLAISIGTLIISLSTIYILTALLVNKKKAMICYQLIVFSILFLFSMGIIENNYPLWFYIFLQTIMMSFANCILVCGSIIKVFPVTHRMTMAAGSWSIARLINFFVVTFALSLLVSKNHFDYACWIVMAFIVAGMVAVKFYIPYERLGIESIKRMGKVKSVESPIITSGEVDAS